MGLSTFLEYVVEEQIDQIKVVDVGAEVGGGHGRPHVLRYVIDFRSAMLCIMIGYNLQCIKIGKTDGKVLWFVCW